MSVRNLIRRSNVTLICTTDDPADDLKWHKMIAEDESFEVQVLPAWRPDKAMNLEKPDYVSYLEKLGQAADSKIESFEDLLAIYSWAYSLPLRVVCFPSETPLEKTKFSFASGYQLEIASGLGMGRVSTSPLSTGTPSGLDPCRECTFCQSL